MTAAAPVIPSDIEHYSELETARILADIRLMEPALVARIPEFDEQRRIPADVIADLKRIGVFDVLTPRSHGGLQLGLVSSVLVLEELARIDASLAWATMIGMESPQILALLPRDTYDELFLADERPLFGGTFLPAGKAQKVDGGYRVSGRWGFASGCQNWDLVFGNCIVIDENGDTLPGRLPGTPRTRAMVMPAYAVTIEDTWKTLGMRGSGSHHFHAEDIFVPDNFAFDILFDRPNVDGVGKFPIAEFNTHITAIILGTARGALEEFRETAKTKQRMGSKVTAAKNPVVQDRVGRIEAGLRAARSYLLEEGRWLAELDGTEDFEDITIEHTGPLNAWVTKTSVEAVDAVWALSGASNAYEGSTIQRRLRDISVSRQHAAVTDTAFARLGAAMFNETHEVSQQTQTAPQKA
ncbi:acyl-CoA dehydrogenase family protein [Arthrobacter sp. KNU40]|uniref:acyl-CoA dehydrogenase family protein n=1 Tax=Arthrobacter sp. KNU40 TaxID=3447965 RepID=UPI003F5E93B4